MNTQEKINFLKLAIMDIKGTSATFSITEDTVLMDLGLDSLDIVELQMYYEDKTHRTTVDPTNAIVKVKDLLDIMT
jgi:acyl carrier protein